MLCLNLFYKLYFNTRARRNQGVCRYEEDRNLLKCIFISFFADFLCLIITQLCAMCNVICKSKPHLPLQANGVEKFQLLNGFITTAAVLTITSVFAIGERSASAGSADSSYTALKNYLSRAVHFDLWQGI